jgi:hypothetical protein
MNRRNGNMHRIRTGTGRNAKPRRQLQRQRQGRFTRGQARDTVKCLETISGG